MTATVTALPAAKRGAPELERLVVGGLLDLGSQGDAQGLLDALALAPEDFEDPTLRWGLKLAQRLAQSKRSVTAQTVFASGRSLKAFGDEAAELFTRLTAESSLTRGELVQVARDLRRAARGKVLAAALVEQAQALVQGRAQLEAVAERTAALAERTAIEFVPDSDASGDVAELHDRWNEHREAGTSALLPSGIQVLDGLIDGFAPNLTLLAAEPGVGKTAVLATVIRAILERDPEAELGVFGLEDGTSWLAKRWCAADLGIPLKQVGWAKLSDELEAQRAEAAAKHAQLLQRVVCYRRGGISAAQLVQRATGWKAHRPKLKALLIDHLGEVKNDGWESIVESVGLVRDFALRHQLPTIAAIHTVTDPNFRGSGPPRAAGLAGGRTMDRRARLVLGLWRKGDALRCTVLKDTEGGHVGETVEFERLKEAAMVSPTGGSLIDVQAERAAEKANREREADERAEKRREKTEARKAAAKAKKDAAKAEKVKAEPAQKTLLGGGA